VRGGQDRAVAGDRRARAQLSNTVLTHHELRELLDQLCDEADEGSTWVLVVPTTSESVPVTRAGSPWRTAPSVRAPGRSVQARRLRSMCGVYDRAPTGREAARGAHLDPARHAGRSRATASRLRTGVVLRRAPVRVALPLRRWSAGRPGTACSWRKARLVPCPLRARRHRCALVARRRRGRPRRHGRVSQGAASTDSLARITSMTTSWSGTVSISHPGRRRLEIGRGAARRATERLVATLEGERR